MINRTMPCCNRSRRQRRRRTNNLAWKSGASTILLLLLLLLDLATAKASSEATVSSQSVDERNGLKNEKSKYEDAFHGRQRSLLRNPLEYSTLNSTSSTSATPSQVNVTIEATALPLFQCLTSDCRNELRHQQDSILSNLTATFANVTLLASTQRIANALFVQLDTRAGGGHDQSSIFETVRQINGVARVVPQETYQPYQFFSNFFGSNTISIPDYLGVPSGIPCHNNNDNKKNATPIRIAVLDSGMDYTHERLGGPGTTEAYEAAYGVNGIASTQHTQVDESLFPNNVVVDGYDFLGDAFLHTAASTAKDAQMDNDPIDAVPGHGTAVADAIRQVAPHAKLVALKVCSTAGHTCPDFAIAQAIEYALDPKGDGSREGGVDVINLSLGLPYFSPYYDFISKLLEDVFHLGVVPVVAMGNHFNVPMVGGYSSISPSIISVGATLHPREQSQLSSSNNNHPIDKQPTMAAYSSRGPGFGGMIKPDLVAPSGMRLAASGTGTGMYAKITGTSFAAPLVTGAVALLKQKCGSACSPFAIKALLMNHGFRDVRYEQDSNNGDATGAPISHMGAGELQVDKSLEATFWAYCVEDVQPSVSLGVLNVASTMVVERTLRITSISPMDRSLTFSVEFRDKNKEESGALTVEFSMLQVDLAGNTDTGNCMSDDSSESNNSFVDVKVTFTIDAAKVPPNHMTSTGPIRDDAALTLDINEFGGHLIVTSETDSTDISVPFMAILRQASDVSISSSKLKYDGKPTEMSVGLTNHGAGAAHVDAFQVLSFGKDEKEAKFGDAVEKADLRMVGYRVVTPPTGESEGCTYMFEWAFQTWEPQARLQTTVFEVQIDLDKDQNIDYMISNAVVNSKHSGAAGDILIRTADGEIKCAGLHADHHTYSTTTVLRVCSEDLGITNPGDMVVQTRVMTVQYTGESQTTASSGYATYLTYPEPEISVPSYDVGPGESLESISISGSYTDANGYPPLGLMLLTDAYRHPRSTGAAAKGTETMLLLADFVQGNFEVHEESTSDALQIPPASDLKGPTCSWSVVCTEDSTSRTSFLKRAVAPNFTKNHTTGGKEDLDSIDFSLFQLEQNGDDKLPSCPLRELQQAFIPSTTTLSTNSPTSYPSLRPSTAVTGTPNIDSSRPVTTAPSEELSMFPPLLKTDQGVSPMNTSMHTTNSSLTIPPTSNTPTKPSTPPDITRSPSSVGLVDEIFTSQATHSRLCAVFTVATVSLIRLLM